MSGTPMGRRAMGRLRDLATVAGLGLAILGLGVVIEIRRFVAGLLDGGGHDDE